ncbi:hypothetical protein Y1Q_0003615 [Alligator mississippiensis]|uniref:Uncharacterized protein n=1 Tax=Alligator mississippiensis TaxID=8496 RepID=A0A151MRI8_ALLMI|nr:hypothetical protein Y1Q_0003615 [Alligator mississippiensis]
MYLRNKKGLKHSVLLLLPPRFVQQGNTPAPTPQISLQGMQPDTKDALLNNTEIVNQGESSWATWKLTKLSRHAENGLKWQCTNI